jgi:putative transposase
LLRGERPYQAFFRRRKNGETPGYPRFQSLNRWHPFTYAQYGNGAVLDGGMLSLSKIARIPVRKHRPLQGTPKAVTIVKEADGWYVCFSCTEVLVEPVPVPATRRASMWGSRCSWSRHRASRWTTRATPAQPEEGQ